MNHYDNLNAGNSNGKTKDVDAGVLLVGDRPILIARPPPSLAGADDAACLDVWASGANAQP